MEFRMVLKEDGSVSTPGVDMAGKVTVHHRDGDILVVKVAGGTYWSGIGMPRSYAPARFLVLRHIEGDRWSKIVGFPVRGAAS